MLPCLRRNYTPMPARRVFLGAALAGVALALVGARSPARASSVTSRTAHSFSFPDIDGGTLRLSDHAGRAVLVVNTASRCGFTSQYAGLQQLHERYASEGLTIIGVPSNDFGQQEPGTEQEIRAFCSGTYGVQFPMTGKTRVRGASAHPFYRWARDELGPQNAPRWNFHKYLVGRDGRLLAAFPSHVTPMGQPIREAVEAALQAPSSI